jgi:ketosteroid isomerase-like protein
MDNIEIVKEITNALCENKHDQQILTQYFAPGFEHIANGRRTNLEGYAKHLASYMSTYKSFSITAWDDIFAAGDKVVASYTLEGKADAGERERVAVMAIWRLSDGKVVSLREVDAPLSE